MNWNGIFYYRKDANCKLLAIVKSSYLSINLIWVACVIQGKTKFHHSKLTSIIKNYKDDLLQICYDYGRVL